MLFGSRPQPKAHARRLPASAAAALLGRGARDLDGDKTARAGARIEARAAGEAAVDHYRHPFDREARLGDVGGEHDLAPSRRVRAQRAVLLGTRQIAVEGKDRNCTFELGERPRSGTDLARPG